MHLALLRRGWSDSGGAEAYLGRLSQALFDAGHRVTLYGSGDKSPRWKHDFIALPGQSPEAFARAWAAQPREWDVSLSLERVPGCDFFRAGDGVHAAWMARRRAQAPVWRKLFWRFQPKHRQLLALERQLCAAPAPTRIIANSQLVARELREYYQVPPERLAVILNGYDAPKIDPTREAEKRATLRRDWGLVASETAVLFAGSGWERKGLRPAIKALEQTSRLRLIVAGKGPAKWYQSPKVTHLGAVPNLADLFAGADFLLHPTLYDPFSNACLEALAAGLPVVTTSDNGFAELLAEGETGSVLDSGWTPEDLARSLQFWQKKVGPENTVESVAALREACRQGARPWSVARNLAQTLAYLTVGRS